MRSSIQSGLLLASLAAPAVSAERVLGAYIYARHGDRTAKILGNTQLTDLGYHEVFAAGSYWNKRYVATGSDKQIHGISDPIVVASQVNASAPSDAVLQNSATGFLQGIYPPAHDSANTTLGNGTVVDSPLNGYQLIQLQPIASGSNSESSSWLQGSTGCSKATVSSNNYYTSDSYNEMLKSTSSFYQSLSPVLNRTFSSEDMSFENAYTIYDYLNVGDIHNSSSEFPGKAKYMTDENKVQLLSLASVHEWNLAYNASDEVRAISGAVVLGGILDNFDQLVSTGGKKSILNVQFGSYGTIMSFFGLMDMPAASDSFYGIPDYASSMSFELVTNDTSSDFPSTDDISVRFLFHNATITGSDEPTVFPMFGEKTDLLSYNDFTSRMEQVAITSTSKWCDMCGNTDGSCASSSASSTENKSSSGGSGGISRPVAGVIGAMVTLAVILGLEALFFLVGGFRLAKRSKASPEMATASSVSSDKKA
ncbi:Histidine phosphatase superfamily clade-2 [Penicillium angulare]|uniref:Histidine phosphatase superfamily clade-2 n=1 Tax=Penicillium angulare TaxID=116970 RepID=A0A9W9G922_9EURO|nr:Histidine phosphatase superfamily clade-2 [Penicillium angulare]